LSILDQILCTWSTYFIGTSDSTFTLRIFEEREILGSFDSDSTFNYLCPDLPEEEDVFTEVTDCKQPTKWRMKTWNRIYLWLVSTKFNCYSIIGGNKLQLFQFLQNIKQLVILVPKIAQFEDKGDEVRKES